MRHLKDPRRQCIVLIAVALAVRLVFVAFLAAPVNLTGGDAWWYLETGRDLLYSAERGPIPAGPGYLVLVGVIGNLFPEPAVIPLVQLVQAALGAATVGLVYLVGRRLWSHGVGMIAGAVIAVSPAFIVETAQIATEGLFIALLMGALALYVWRGESAYPPGGRALSTVGVLLGMATLTRAVLLAFPAALVLHLVWVHGWRRAVRPALTLALAFTLTLAPWTVYNLVRWNRFVVAAEGFVSFLWLGTQEEGWQGPEQTDAALGVTPENPDNRDYTGKAAESIRADLPGYVALRLRNLSEAVVQPHNTTYFHGESLKAAGARWLSEDRTLSGLLALAEIESFWPKLAVYVFHFAGIALGLAGMVIQARRPGGVRAAFPLYVLAAYFVCVHLLLYVIPRYLFPLEPVWWLFAALALSRVWAVVGAQRARRAAH